MKTKMTYVSGMNLYQIAKLEKQEHEEIMKVEDFSKVVTHYLYPFNKQNIEMIDKMTRNNREGC